MDDLVKRAGIYYKKFTEIPFTGKVTVKSQGSLKNGKRVGPWVFYKKNGTKRFTKNYTMDEGSDLYRNGKKVSD